MPGRRYEPLDKYIREHLLPDLQMRIQCWDQAELCYLPLPVPDCIHNRGNLTLTVAAGDEDKTVQALAETDTGAAGDDSSLGLSMVTLSG
jgi:hypothetical protein